MFISTRKTSNWLIKKEKNDLMHENIKICLVYLILGFIWVYFSDRIANLLFTDRNILVSANTYKGTVYVIVTTCILYFLIDKFFKRIYYREKQLKESYVELQVYVKQLAASEEKNRAIVKAIPDILFVLNRDGVFLECEASNDDILLKKKDFLIGKTINEIMPKEISELAYRNLNLVFNNGELQSFEYQLNYERIHGYFEVRMVKRGKEKVLAILRDITRRKELENSLEYLSYNDQLTGLKNRRFYEEELKRLDVKENLPLTIVLGDVNGLKLINDSFGHDSGDELIRKAGTIISKGCSPEYIVTRVGGDEFVILLPKTDDDKAKEIIENINKLMQKEKVENINISISFGYETKRNDEEDIQEVFRKAEKYMYKKKLFEGSYMKGRIVNTIINTLNEKNKQEEQHPFRVSQLCKSIGKSIGLPEGKIEELQTAALLHDIGKIAIDENILNKAGKLTDDEYQEIKRHPEIGYRILNTINGMSEIAKYVLLHHEKWNGSGYPKGLKGESIPLAARIIAIADAFDSMISERNYRRAMPERFALEELKKNAGIQFDPELVNVFIEKALVNTAHENK